MCYISRNLDTEIKELELQTTYIRHLLFYFLKPHFPHNLQTLHTDTSLNSLPLFHPLPSISTPPWNPSNFPPRSFGPRVPFSPELPSPQASRVAGQRRTAHGWLDSVRRVAPLRFQVSGAASASVSRPGIRAGLPACSISKIMRVALENNRESGGTRWLCRRAGVNEIRGTDWWFC